MQRRKPSRNLVGSRPDVIPACVAAATSILSKPTPARPTTTSFVPLAERLAVTWV